MTADRTQTFEAVVSTPSSRRPWSRAGLVGFTLLGGGAIFVVGSPYFELTAWNDSALYNGLLAGGFGLLTVVLRRHPALSSLKSCGEALFLAATAMFVVVVGPFNWLVTLHDESYRHALQDKLAQFLAVVPVIALLTWATGRPWGWIYLQRGQLRRWLAPSIALLAVGATVISIVAVAQGITTADLLAAAPWIVAFAVLNAVMEELWFRGIFLRPYAAGMGGALAVVVTAVVFGAAHVGATYVSAGQQLLFAALVAGLGSVLAIAMRWGDSLWGAVMLHVALDLVVVFELVESA